MKPRRWKTLAANLALLTVVTVLTLAILDVLLIATGMFPPKTDPGHPEVGWLAAPPTGAMREERCFDPTAGKAIGFMRNEDGVRSPRSAAELSGPGTRFEIVVGGDSHTDLCATNADTHIGATERILTDSGLPTDAYAFGSGKYSPLQAYLAVAPLIEAYRPDALVLNLYTGNDFYDMLRPDDRPHFVPADSGYAIAPPVWYQSDPPEMKRRSRVLYAFRLLSDATGVRRVWVRVKYLRAVAAEQGKGIGTVVRYMNDLRRATVSGVGYPQAFSAQMLNQQIFFHRFPGSREESVRRIDALLGLIRERHPDLTLILSPIPSYQLVLGAPKDTLLTGAVARLPITFEGGVREEEELYRSLVPLAAARGWVFVDNLAPLRAHPDPLALYNHRDYHLEPIASGIIGQDQASALLAIRARSARR